MLREARIESRLQYMQDALLDETVEDGRYPELSETTILLWNRMPSYRLRLVTPREDFLANTIPVLRQILRQLFHRHPVDPGAALVLLHPSKCCFDVAAFDDELQQLLVVVSRALASVCRRARFTTPIGTPGFTLRSDSQLRLPGLLVPFALETHARCTLLAVRPFASLRLPGVGLQPGPASRSLLRPRLTSRSVLPLQSPSPFQA